MATNRYSLADYILTISLPNGEEEKIQNLLSKSGLSNDAPISIGGPGENGNEGSFLGSIKVKRNKKLWDTDGDNTGSWVHNKNLDRTGTVDLDINQVSDNIVRLAMICNAYESIQDAIGGLTLEVKNAYDPSLPSVAICYDCYIDQIPDQDFENSAKTQSWSFTCGRVMFY